MKISDIQTPALLLDQGKVAANTTAMTRRLQAHGVNLRPHMKTAKSIDVARLALAGNFGGVTVSTLKEAVYFLGHGVTDIVYAVCIQPSKLDVAAGLKANGADLKVITDNVSVARAIADHGDAFEVLIEIDCGEHRTGISPDDPDVMEIASILAASEHASLAGVMTHGGHSYQCRGEAEIQQVAIAERDAAVSAAERLRAGGHDCAIVSVGSTPTATYAEDLTGVTEARPGVFVFYDLFQLGLGVCEIDNLALSVVASVISHRRDTGQILIDAGGLALSKDRSTGALDEDLGFGQICDARSGEPVKGLVVAGVHQEHGQINVSDEAMFDRLPVGAKVRVLPNHACMTAAAYGEYHVIDGADDVVAKWSRCNGW